MISINNVDQLYGGTQILWGLDLEIETGSITCIMGRNGVGKTTLLKAIMGLLPIKSGEITMKGAVLINKAQKNALIQALVMCLKGAIFFLC